MINLNNLNNSLVIDISPGWKVKKVLQMSSYLVSYLSGCSSQVVIPAFISCLPPPTKQDIIPYHQQSKRCHHNL